MKHNQTRKYSNFFLKNYSIFMCYVEEYDEFKVNLHALLMALNELELFQFQQ